MKIIHGKYFFTWIISIIVTLFSMPSFATEANELMIINHYNQSLRFLIDYAELLPDLPQDLILSPNQQIKTRICTEKQHAYLRTEDITNNKHFAFWGVEFDNDEVLIHGYLSNGIAYSWNNNIVTFCTVEEYKQNGSC